MSEITPTPAPTSVERKPELAAHVEGEAERGSVDLKQADQPVVAGFTGKHADMYAEALEKYGAEGSIPEEAERRLKRYVNDDSLGAFAHCAAKSTVASCLCSASATFSIMSTRRQ